MHEQRVSGGNSWITWIMVGFALSAPSPSLPAAEPEINPDDLRPGLIATYTAKDGNSTVSVTRLEPTIALALTAGESPHPRLPANNSKVHWEGYLNILRPGDYVFHARAD